MLGYNSTTMEEGENRFWGTTSSEPHLGVSFPSPLLIMTVMPPDQMSQRGKEQEWPQTEK